MYLIPVNYALKMIMLCYAKLLQSCLTLCDPIDGSPPGSVVPGILQARTLEWDAISFSGAWKEKSESEVAQSCPTLSDPMDCSLPGSSIHGIFQARVLEWGGWILPFFLAPNNVVSYSLHRLHGTEKYSPEFSALHWLNIQKTVSWHAVPPLNER